jgi:hypothetical protein
VQTWQEMRWVLLQRAAEQDQVDLEVINPANEIAIRRLDVSSVRRSGWEGDALDRLGFGLYRPRLPPVLGKINANSAADAAGLRPGDEILSIDEQLDRQLGGRRARGSPVAGKSAAGRGAARGRAHRKDGDAGGVDEGEAKSAALVRRSATMARHARP